MLRNQAHVPASSTNKRAGDAKRTDAHTAVTPAEGRFFMASNKLATLNAMKPGACPGKQGAETGMRDVARLRS